MKTDTWALEQAMHSLEAARLGTLLRGQPPTRWSVTLLWQSGEQEVYALPPARNLKTLVRHVRAFRARRRPTWLFTTGKLTYTEAGVEMPHLVVVLAGESRCVMLHAAIDSDGNPCPAQVRMDPDPALLGPLLRMGR